MQIAGTTAFITGGGGGISGAIAAALAERGAKIVFADIEAGFAEKQASELGGETLAIALDVTSCESWAAARKKALAQFGQVDILRNNAGISTPRMNLEDFPADLFARGMAVNVTGVFNRVTTFVPARHARQSERPCG